VHAVVLASRRSGPAARTATIVLGSAALLVGPTLAASADFAVDLVVGSDTNPLQVEDDGPNGLFSEIRMGAGASGRMSPRVGWRFSGAVAVRAYESSVEDAATEAGYGRLGLEWLLGSTTGRPGVLGFGIQAGVDRSTFTDRATGDVYVVDPDPITTPPTSIPIPNRFDAATAGAYVDANVRLGRRAGAFVTATMESTHFLESYEAETSLESLDYDVVTVEPGVRVALHSTAALRCSIALIALDYDEQPALASDGQPVPGTTREYRTTDLRVALSLAPFSRWSFDIGLRGGPRSDTQAGYYDLDTLGASVAMTHRPSWRTRLQLSASSRDVDYARAPVTSSPDGELRGSRVDRLAGRFDYDLRRPTTVYAETGVERVQNNDPVFAHDRSWLAVGIRYRP